MKKWNINYINHLRNVFVNRLHNATDMTEQHRIIKSLESIDRIIKATEKTSFSSLTSKVTHMAILEEDSLLFTQFGYYCPYIRILQSYYDLVEIKTENYKRLFPTDDSLIHFSKSFYSHVGGKFKEAFTDIAMRFDKTLRIGNAYISKKCSGSTYNVYGTKVAFIDFNKTGTIQDYLSINHETSHAISIQMNSRAFWDSEKYCFKEVDSLFFEMLTLDTLDNEFDDEALKVKLDTFNDYLYSAEILGAKMDLLNEFSSFKLVDKKAIINYLLDNGYDKQAISDILSESSVNLFDYVISYLTAIELYFIYEVDKNLALSILEKIIMCNKDNRNDYLDYVKSLGINPGDNLDKYVGHLMNQSKKDNYIYEKTI